METIEPSPAVIDEMALVRARPDLGALIELGRWLQSMHYAFTTVSPETHGTVNARQDAQVALNLRDVFGWSRPFADGLLPARVLSMLDRAGALITHGALHRSGVRYATLDGDLFVHSAYPTTAADSVFFGPDSYRFIAFVRENLPLRRNSDALNIVDIGCGSGVGGIRVARAWRGSKVILADINHLALGYANVNASLAQVDSCACVASDVLAAVPGSFDLVISNPPYMADAGLRHYRDGGGMLGAALSLRILQESLPRLSAGGRLLLYTGSAIVDGIDRFRAAAESIVLEHGDTYRYREIDPDVFGEELRETAYAEVERVAAVGLVVDKY